MPLSDLLTAAFFKAIEHAGPQVPVPLEYTIKDSICRNLREEYTNNIRIGSAAVIPEIWCSVDVRFDLDGHHHLIEIKRWFSLVGQRNVHTDLIKLMDTPPLHGPKTIYSISYAASAALATQCNEVCAELNQRGDWFFEYSMRQQQGITNDSRIIIIRGVPVSRVPHL